MDKPTTSTKSSGCSKVLKWFAVLVVLMACYLQYNPTIIFKIPKYGFLLGPLVGFPIPPFFDLHAYDACVDPNDPGCSFLQSGDVVVAAAAKCGTNWMMTLVHELRTWDKPELREFDDILDIVPWIEMANYPGETIKTRPNHWGSTTGRRWNHTDHRFHVYKSHYMPRSAHATAPQSVLPVAERRDVKFIAVVRNVEDYTYSAHQFLNKPNPEWSDYWGGFPGVLVSSMDATIELTTDPNSGLSVTGYLKDWWAFRDDPNVLFLHYGDIYKNLGKYVRIVAEFVGVETEKLTEEDWKRIEKRTSFNFMKERGNKYLHRGGLNMDMKVIGEDGLISKGGSVDKETKKVAFTSDQIKLIHDRAKALLTPEQYKYLMEGNDTRFTN